MTYPEPAPVTARQTLATNPEALFGAWTDPALLRRWLNMGPGWSTPYAASDPRPGGRFAVFMQPPRGRLLRYRGAYRSVGPNDHIEVTWPAYGRDELQTLLRVEFIPVPAGATMVVITHTDLPDESARFDHMAGWSAALEQLATACASGILRSADPSADEPPAGR